MSTSRLEIRVRDRRSGAATDHSFKHGPVRIGRDPACELHLADPHVSHKHAVLETNEQGAHLIDLGGTNGLRVAGRRLAPHAAIPVGDRLCVSLGPFDLEVVHTPDRDRQAASGALTEPGPVQLEQLHASLRHLHTLHAPHVAARQAFEAALADAVHVFHTAGDPPAVRRILAEFPAVDHAHLVLTAANRAPSRPASEHLHTPPDLSQPPAARAAFDLSPTPLSQRAPAPLDLSSPAAPHGSPPASVDPPNLSHRTPPTEPHPPAPHHNLPAAQPAPPAPATPRNASTQPLALIAEAAHALLPDQRPPANFDEARRFLERLVGTLRSFAAGVGALQHLRLQQARDLDLATLDHVNPLLTSTSADELLTELLTWREHTDRSPELLDAFAVLTAHARAHVCAALAATRHLAAELSPLTVDRHAARGLLRSRARWHSFLDRYTACLGDGAATSGTLRASFRAAYLDELNHQGLAVTPRNP